MAILSKAGEAGHEGQSPNYDYVVDWVARIAAENRPSESAFRALDYGCGRGTAVAKGRLRGIEFYGADTYDGFYANWQKDLDPKAAPHVTRISDGTIDAPDGYFDVVVSNQVFEHVQDPPKALAEIARVLKPGGTFLALFPTRDIWFEGHLGLYFVHWLSPWQSLQRAYMRTLRRIGFGYYVGASTPAAWSKRMQRTLHDAVFYHDMRDVDRWWRAAFGAPPASEAEGYMRYRLERSRLAKFASLAGLPLASLLLRFVCRVRAGRILVVRKSQIE